MCCGCEGDKGPTGPAGAANVIYSDWYETTWDLYTVFGTAERTFTMTAPALTQEIVDNGVIMVFLNAVGYAPEIVQLPVTFNDVHYHFMFRAQAGTIRAIYYSTTDPTMDPGAIPGFNRVRYVLIPGGVLDEAAQEKGVARPDLTRSMDALSYSEICGLFNIPE